jgi:hypothetical protein
MRNSDYCWIKKSLIRTKTFCVYFFLFFSYNYSYSQKVIQIDKIEGCQVLYPNLTIEEAQFKAVTQAKINALQEAGIAEQISSNQYYEVERSVRVNKDKFYESTTSDIKGEIVKFNLLEYKQSVGSTGEILICAQINVSVLKHDISKINSNNLEFSGIQDKYKKGEPIEFRLKSSSDLFYWVFLIDSDEKYQLIYPMTKYESNSILKNQEIILPNSKDYKWNVDTTKSEELNSILVVYSNINYLIDNKINDFNSWSDWFQKMEYSSRNKIIKPFKIYK